MRVEIPAWTDRWMMGDRCGEVVKIVPKPEPDRDGIWELAYVKLDKSGKTLPFPLEDCVVL